MVGPLRSFLPALAEHEVKYVVIGGVATVLHGASLMTQDLDIVAEFSHGNLVKIANALVPFDPHHRITSSVMPFSIANEADSVRWKNLYLKTDVGIIDILSEVKGLGGFEECSKASEPIEVDDITFRMLSIDALITAKEAVGRDKDIAAVRELKVIRATR